MPSMRRSYIDLDPAKYRPVSPVAHPVLHINPAPEPPISIHRSPVMVSSLPSLVTSVDGATRQFYGGPHVPTRRLILAGL